MPNVCIFAPDLTHELETIGFYFRLSGAEVAFATQPDGKKGSEHPQGLRRLEQTQRFRWLSDEPGKFDLLVSDAFIEPHYREQRTRWASQANEIAFLFPHRGMTLKRRIGHLVRSWPYSIKSRKAIFFGDNRLSLDTVSPALQRRAFYSPYLHPELLVEGELAQVFAGVDTETPRRYRIGFMGNKNPRERTIALMDCRRAIDQVSAETFWIEYGDDVVNNNALKLEQYLSALAKMDFCICPAGWSGWTHRVVESLCRGAIPILPHAYLYGLSLKNHVNCILVEDGNWYDSVKSALALPAHRLQEIRTNVLVLRDTLLTPKVASHRFSRQFGLDST